MIGAIEQIEKACQLSQEGKQDEAMNVLRRLAEKIGSREVTELLTLAIAGTLIAYEVTKS